MRPIPSTLSVIDWQRLQQKLLWIYEGPPGADHKEGEGYDTIGVWLILRGRVQVTGRHSKRRTFGAKSWVSFLADEHMSHHFSSEALILSIRFRLHWNNQESLFPIREATAFSAEGYPLLETLARRLLRVFKRGNRPGYNTFLDAPMTFAEWAQTQGRFWQWVSEWARAVEQEIGLSLPDSAPDPRIQEAVRLIVEADWNQPQSEAELAKSAGISVAQLNRLFLKYFGKTPKRFAEDRRLQEARKLLARTSDSIKSVAYQMGFSYPTQFTSWFRRKEGRSPRQFRADRPHPSLRAG